MRLAGAALLLLVALARLGTTTGTRGWHTVTSIDAVALLLAFGVYAVGILNGRRMRPGASG